MNPISPANARIEVFPIPQFIRRRLVAAAVLLAATAVWPPAGLAAASDDGFAARHDRILVRPFDDADLTQLDRTLGVKVLREFPAIGGLRVVELPSHRLAEDVIRAYRRSGLVRYAERDYLVRLQAEPNDFRFWDGTLWGLRNQGQLGGTPGADIDAVAGWDIRNTAEDVVIAVLDTGMRLTHEDLAGNLWVNPGESGLDAGGIDRRTNGIDDDGNGYVDDVHGINALLDSGLPLDDHGHGTHVSGTIGATGNNSVGVVGVAWRTRLMSCKFINNLGQGAISDAIRCMDYARSHGAKIVNASWGDYSFTSSALRDAINSLRDAGLLVVAAAGNNANDNDARSMYPASYEYDNVIAVAATDGNDLLAGFSNFGGLTVDLGAPGSPIFSAWNGSDSDYRYMDGTSMATPLVSGACALVWQQYPDLSHHEVIARIFSQADPLPTLQGVTVTGGRLNLARALGPQTDPVVPAVTVWVDDDVPAGAQTGGAGGDTWHWVTGSPAPISGARAHQSALANGLHYHSFERSDETMVVHPRDTLFVHVYLDPVDTPRQVMVNWNDGCWEHRAYWGEDLIPYGMSETSSRLYAGPLPAAGQWVRLEVPAAAMRLEGAVLRGMSFMLVDGRATWDAAGRAAPAAPTP